jgi:hypothetical protein
MHLIVPFAAVSSPAMAPALAQCNALRLPQLHELLVAAHAQAPVLGDEWSFNTPAERALAQALGVDAPDGLLPTAAWLAQAQPDQPDWQPDPSLPLGLLCPAHWRLGTEQISLLPPSALALDAAASRAFFAAVAPLFESEGAQLHWAAPLRWYVQHSALAGLRCASLHRVVGRNVDRWLPAQPEARLWRRLQNEVQMLLYTHPLNAQREAQGLLALNSFWLCGAGAATRVHWPAGLQVDERLVEPALAEDAVAWLDAWRTLDDEVLAPALVAAREGQPLRLTLCGERGAQSLVLATGVRQAPWWRRWWPGGRGAAQAWAQLGAVL